jgi:hypothetical protein
MSKKWISFLLTAVLAALVLAPGTAMAVCKVQVISKISFTDSTTATTVSDPTPLTPGDKVSLVTGNLGNVPALDAAEGITERISDLLITDDAAGVFCFQTGNNIVITLNAILTDPSALTVPRNIDLYDSNGVAGVTIAAPIITPGFAANQAQTVITIPIQQTGTAGDLTVGPTGSAIRVKNLRVDSSKITGTPIVATVSATAQTVAGNPFTVGSRTNTIAAASIAAGTGTQSSSASTAASFTFTEGFFDAFRTCGGNAATGTGCAGVPHSGVANDIATNPTSLVVDLATSIPSGVTVTFPTVLTNSASAAGTAGAGYIFTLTSRSGSSSTGVCTGAANCFLIYDRTAEGSAAFTATVSATVAVASPSGFGTATVHAFFGRAVSSPGGNDDVDPTSIPRYMTPNTGAFGVSRNIVSGNFFTINPVRTTLLYPFVSTVGNFNTGISVANTGNDTGVFAAGSGASQTGGLTIYFFPTGSPSFSLSTDLSAGGTALPSCRGLNASGLLVPGGNFACAVSALLTAAGKPALFDGYVIVVTQFNKAHGFSAQFSGAGAPFAANNALVLGSATRADGAAENLNE